MGVVETLNRPNCSLRDCNNQSIQKNFYESEVVRFAKDDEHSTNISLECQRMSQQQSFTVNLAFNASMSTFPDDTLAKLTTLLPQSLVLHGTWEVGLAEFSWPGLIENVTEDQVSYILNRDEENRDTSTREPIVECPRFGYGMVFM